MSFNIEDFKARNSIGFLKPSNFLVMIPPPAWAVAGGISPNPAYLAQSCNLPGVTISSVDAKPYGAGPTVRMPFDIQVTDCRIQFYADGDGAYMHYFYDWIRNVVNLHHDQGGVGSNRTGMSNQVNYRGEYTTQIDICLFTDQPWGTGQNPREDCFMIFSLYDAFPKTFIEPSLSWTNGQEIMTYGVEFTYRSFEIQRFAIPGPSNRSEVGDLSPLIGLQDYVINIAENCGTIQTPSASFLDAAEAALFGETFISLAIEALSSSDLLDAFGNLGNLNDLLGNFNGSGGSGGNFLDDLTGGSGSGSGGGSLTDSLVDGLSGLL